MPRAKIHHRTRNNNWFKVQKVKWEIIIRYNITLYFPVAIRQSSVGLRQPFRCSFLREADTWAPLPNRWVSACRMVSPIIASARLFRSHMANRESAWGPVAVQSEYENFAVRLLSNQRSAGPSFRRNDVQQTMWAHCTGPSNWWEAQNSNRARKP